MHAAFYSLVKIESIGNISGSFGGGQEANLTSEPKSDGQETSSLNTSQTVGKYATANKLRIVDRY
jgi:hypothetical protein